jgi:hypothetical protein
MYGNGEIYGTTLANTAFRVTLGGDFTSFGALPGGITSNTSPNGLTYANDGNLYGTSVGSNTLFQLTPDGVSTTLQTFAQIPGYMLQGPDGRLYGTAEPSRHRRRVAVERARVGEY